MGIFKQKEMKEPVVVNEVCKCGSKPCLVVGLCVEDGKWSCKDLVCYDYKVGTDKEVPLEEKKMDIVVDEFSDAEVYKRRLDTLNLVIKTFKPKNAEEAISLADELTKWLEG